LDKKWIKNFSKVQNDLIVVCFFVDLFKGLRKNIEFGHSTLFPLVHQALMESVVAGLGNLIHKSEGQVTIGSVVYDYCQHPRSDRNNRKKVNDLWKGIKNTDISASNALEVFENLGILCNLIENGLLESSTSYDQPLSFATSESIDLVSSWECLQKISKIIWNEKEDESKVSEIRQLLIDKRIRQTSKKS